MKASFYELAFHENAGDDIDDPANDVKEGIVGLIDRLSAIRPEEIDSNRPQLLELKGIVDNLVAQTGIS